LGVSIQMYSVGSSATFSNRWGIVLGNQIESPGSKKWISSPIIAANRSQDVVHRAVGKAGIVLVGEGNPNRVRSLLASEKKKMARIVTEVPVHDFIVGDGEGQVPLKKLRTTLLKLPRTLSGPQVTETNDRLRAMGDLMSNMPIPKGPMPKGMRMPKGGQGGGR